MSQFHPHLTSPSRGRNIKAIIVKFLSPGEVSRSDREGAFKLFYILPFPFHCFFRIDHHAAWQHHVNKEIPPFSLDGRR